jgi:NAD(P)-dependent dehydrogenase (short-subunit alcohol dehydrogenase family)
VRRLDRVRTQIGTIAFWAGRTHQNRFLAHEGNRPHIHPQPGWFPRRARVAKSVLDERVYAPILRVGTLSANLAGAALVFGGLRRRLVLRIRDSVAFVTGANRGLGLVFAQELLAAGARKVYGAARNPERITLDHVERVRLDVTEPDTIAAAVRECTDVNLLINNAGIARWSGLLAPNVVENARSEMETNYFGPLALSRALAPVLAKNGGGAIVNLLSVLSWVANPASGTYSASKAAAWALTNWLRTSLREQGTQVVGVHAGLIDTDMSRELTRPKLKPADVVRQVLDAVEAGRDEVFADELTRRVKAGLSDEVGIYLNYDPQRAVAAAS